MSLPFGSAKPEADEIYTYVNKSESKTPTVQVDADGVKDYSYPDGRYQARLLELEATISSSSNPMIVWTFELLDGAAQGRMIKYFTVDDSPSEVNPNNPDKQSWKIEQCYRMLSGENTNGKELKISKKKVLGKCVTLELKKGKPYKGRINSEVWRVEKPSAATAAAPSATGLKL